MSTDKKISFSEFKFWLQGVEEMQDEGWSPSPAQWEKIKEKIAAVEVNTDNHLVLHRQPQLAIQRANSNMVTPHSAFDDEQSVTDQPPTQAPGQVRTPPPEFFQVPNQSQLDARARPRENMGPYNTPFK